MREDSQSYQTTSTKNQRYVRFFPKQRRVLTAEEKFDLLIGSGYSEPEIASILFTSRFVDAFTMEFDGRVEFFDFRRLI